MSKNVAVFVDVANIFYAAKAAGVDIDYVTLLKSATAGRDFVRAYAYTGLDPENENQRQFHSFLTRSGYKVVSKDIRKYGDGRIKANLDIELVVDLMRMSRNLDIAVLVSGDGDFAPAIRAVQQEGLRVEVISFRGNTSSDLIEVADVFTDITQIARVEKSGRSGRRVALDDDLSMTQVPEKETDGGMRRRRTRTRGERDERRDERVPARAGSNGSEPQALPGNLIVLPGEKLSRVGPEDEPAEDAALAALDEDEGAGAQPSPAEDAAYGADAPRRRRRRGGRGRGRGRRADAEVGVASEPGAEPGEDEDFLDEEVAPIPQHSTFGSVWDSQLGVPSVPLTTAAADLDDEDLEDEPEVPEYILAERRQRQQRGNRGRMGPAGRGRAGYQAAVDRERYGRGGSSFGSPTRMPQGARGPDRGPDRSGRGQRPGPRQQPRPERPPAREPMLSQAPPRSGAEPWSEVPPDVQELLLAELARRGGGTDRAPRADAPSAGEAPFAGDEPTLGAPSEPAVAPDADEAPVASVIEQAPARRRTRRPSAAQPAASAERDAATDVPADAAPPATRARRTPRRAAAPAPEASEMLGSAQPGAVEALGGAEASEPATARRPTRRRTAAASAPDEVAPTAPAGDGGEAATATAPRRRARRAVDGEGTDATGTPEATASAAEADVTPAPPRRRSTRTAAVETDAGADGDGTAT